MSLHRLLSLVALFVSLAATLVEAGAPDAGVRLRARPTTRDAGIAIGVESAEPVHGPTAGCPADCYSSCGSGVHREPGPPTERERRCAGCRNICMDTGKWPPGVPRNH